MKPRQAWVGAIAGGLAIALSTTLAGCSGGGGGGGPQGKLLAVSFVGFPTGPGSSALPQVYRDQALEFTFDGPLDAGVLGGFFEQGGAPVVFVGVAPSDPQGVPYHAFVDQTGAHAALEIRRNITGGPLLTSYVVGRHRDKPEVIVMDPAVPPGNPLSLPANPGFLANNQYVFTIPAGNALSFGGSPAQPVGPTPVSLPIPVPPFTTQPALSSLFQAGLAFGPNPIPPAVLSIMPLSGLPGTPASPITESDPLIVTFSRFITAASINPVANFVVRNLDVVNTSFPEGILVPGSVVPLTPGAVNDLIWIFTPASAYGPGPSPGEGYDIEVRIGTFGVAGVPPLLGVPQGVNGTQLPLSNSLSQTFRATPCSGCPTPSSVVETFANSDRRDATFVQTFPSSTAPQLQPQQARWNDATAPGLLAGRPLSGTPLGNSLASLGTRVQFTVAPQPPSTSPAGLFSPFDASLANSGGACPGIPTGCNLGINPQGGSHIMHVYESVELGFTEDSLELVEWSPVSGVTAPTTYPNYKIWCGVTSTAAPLAGGGQGLAAIFDANYNLTPYQTGIPIPATCASPTATNPRKVPCGGPQPYTVTLQTTTFHAFPVLAPCFDFATSAGTSGNMVNLLFEQDIDPGNQVPNFNSYRSASFTPVRRLIDRPISMTTPPICPFNAGGTFDVYKARFTFVGLVAQARSLWYDTGAPNPTYVDFILSPSVALQPFGTQSVWILEGTDVLNPGPATNGTAVTFVDAAGVVNPAALATLNGLRYFRFRVELRGNNSTNAFPAYTGIQMAYTF
jgi:hypothetical protein